MSRPDPWRLDPAAYPYTDVIQTRFGDLDMLGHINNVAMVALFESARMRFNDGTGLVQWREPRWLIAAQEVNYLAEGRYPGDLTIAQGIGRIGARSWTMLGAAFQEGRPVATGDVTLVLDGPALSDDFRAALTAWQINR